MSSLPPFPNPSESPRWYYIDSSNQTCGPLTADELQSLAATGTITSETLVAREGDPGWKKFAEITREPTIPPVPPMSSTGGKMHPQRLALIVASSIGALGSFLPWVHAPIVGSIPGIKGDGRITLALFLLSLVLCLIGDKTTHVKGYIRWGAVVSACIAADIGLWKIFEFNSNMPSIEDNPLGEAISIGFSIGIGLYAVTLAGCALPILGFSFGTSQKFTETVNLAWTGFGKLLGHWGPIAAKQVAHCWSVIWLRLACVATSVWTGLQKAYSRFPKCTVGAGVLLIVALLAVRAFPFHYRITKVKPESLLYDSRETRTAVTTSYDSGNKEAFKEMTSQLNKEGRVKRLPNRKDAIVAKVISEDKSMRMTRIEFGSDFPEKPSRRWWIETRDLLPFDDKMDSTLNTSTPQQASGSKEEEQYAKFRLGNFSYTIDLCETRSTIGSGYKTTTRASEGAKFLLVHFSILNETNKTQTVTADDFRIRDAKGREYRPSSKANTALAIHGESEDFILRELQPGLEKEGVTAFELPEEALEDDPTLIIPEKGFFGKKQVIVKISLDDFPSNF